MEGGTPFDATHKYAAMWSLLTLVIDKISPSTTFTGEKKGRKCLSREMKIYQKNCRSPFSPLIDISSPSSLRHITYGSGKPFALHVSVTFVPSLTTISLLVIVSMITGGTGISRFLCDDQGEKLSTLTNNLKVTFSWSHGIRVHLTHVPSSIQLFDFSYMQIPTSMVVVCENDARILRYDVVMDAENRLSIHAHPRYLNEANKWNLQH
jgi:hypothetical protein